MRDIRARTVTPHRTRADSGPHRRLRSRWSPRACLALSVHQGPQPLSTAPNRTEPNRTATASHLPNLLRISLSAPPARCSSTVRASSDEPSFAPLTKTSHGVVSRIKALTGRYAPRSHRGAERLAPLDSARHGGQVTNVPRRASRGVVSPDASERSERSVRQFFPKFLQRGVPAANAVSEETPRSKKWGVSRRRLAGRVRVPRRRRP